MANWRKKARSALMLVVTACVLTGFWSFGAGNTAEPEPTEKKIDVDEEVKAEATSRADIEDPAEIARLNLPEDTSVRLSVTRIRVSGNTLIAAEELLANLPLVYNDSDKPLSKAQPSDLYDFRVLRNIIINPGAPRQVSRRTMQGLTEYILRVYLEKGYAGIYIYIASKAVHGDAQLKDGILPIEIVEATVSEIVIKPYNEKREKAEKPILRNSIIEGWSPVKAGQTVKKKELDEFVNLLNQNPDRHVSAVISRGSEPNSLALNYEVYEGNPWHFFIQLDNSGPDERKWAPRFGVVNTNITGRDDKFTAIYQAAVDQPKDNYTVFGSYEFPFLTPRLRLAFFGGHSEFDIAGGGGVDFLGKGTFYGGLLKYNVLQWKSWFFDFTTSLSREESKVTPSLFPMMGSDIQLNLWGLGMSAYRSSRMSNSSVSFNRVQSIGGSPQKDFWNPATGLGARTNSKRNFSIYTIAARHSQYLDPNTVHRLSVSGRYIIPDERLAPSKMTTFGGLYSVRGYDEDEVVADGGLLLSAQYEFDLIKHGQSEADREAEAKAKKTSDEWLDIKKVAILGFTDYARAKTKSPVAGEKGTQELCSVGLGLSVVVGDHIDAAIYYGIPLRTTDETDKGDGRWNFSFVIRF